MAEVLEAMGFPSEWCERALKSTSGLEPAVDLLLQWQAQGRPPPFLPPSSPRPPIDDAETSNRAPAMQAGAGGSRPTLRLHSPSTNVSKAATADGNEREPSHTSTHLPFTSSLTASPFSPPMHGSPGAHHQNVSIRNSDPSSGTLGNADHQPTLRLNVPPPPEHSVPADPAGMALAGAATSVVHLGTGSSYGPGGREESGEREESRGSGLVNNSDTSDAVVPDVFAQERQARYSAARRAKQEKEEEKARIRQHMREDMALRRLRHTYQTPSQAERGKAVMTADEEGENVGEGVSSIPSSVVSMDTNVELQIRCPSNRILKASFAAGTRLKTVRTYVEQQLEQQPLRIDGSQPRPHRRPPGSVPFTGWSACLSTDREAEREIMQAARENFEAQTNQIIASAKGLRKGSGKPSSQNSNGSTESTIYFLIPFPRREFFTEAAMESTLAEAQLVPRGTLMVHCLPSAVEQKPEGMQLRSSGSTTAGRGHISERNSSRTRTRRSQSATAGALEVNKSDVPRSEGLLNSEDGDSSRRPHIVSNAVETVDSGGRALETEGERVRIRERALQAAAKRMGEAARIFHAGLPLEVGETGQAFRFPTDSDQSQDEEDGVPVMTKDAIFHASEDSPLLNLPVAVATTAASVGPQHDPSETGASAGADAELSSAQGPPSEPPHRFGLSPDRAAALDTLHHRAMAAAEARMRSSQLHSPTDSMSVDVPHHEANEAGSRVNYQGKDDDMVDRLSGGGRAVQSSWESSRPEKIQRISGRPHDPAVSRELPSNAHGQPMTGSSGQQDQAQTSGGAERRTGPLEAALQRVKDANEGDRKGKGIIEESRAEPSAAKPPTALLQPETERETERYSSLRVRLEDGSVVPHTFPPDTLLQTVRDSVVPDGADVLEYGFVVPFPEPRFMEGDALAATLEEVGLVPRGTIHLTRLATRGMVREGRRQHRRRFSMDDSDDEMDVVEHMERMFRHLAEREIDHGDPTYEELMQLEDSIGRVHVGVPEEIISSLPQHVVKAKQTETSMGEEGNNGDAEELDLCIVCMADMAPGEEVLSLPCVHTFHSLCIRQWLLQSTCCPTCKQPIVSSLDSLA